LVGLSPSGACYDPYQIRHAYHTDFLIGVGFDGKGKTIVIIDAYQSLMSTTRFTICRA
jgi:hypothetical protein